MNSRDEALLEDLANEVQALNAMLTTLSPEDWSRVTPAPGWNVADQVIHLGLFDRRCMWSMVDPERFAADLQGMRTNGGVDGLHDAERGRTTDDLLSWWRIGAADLLAASRSTDLSARCAWYGPAMSATSMLTARLMETWAHGYDIADAVGHIPVPTQRLKHIAHIGVRARPFAFAANKRDMPDGDVFVSLTSPDGEVWTWGDESASSRVSGEALGFCLAVTQRRHVDDCGLTATGDLAQQWMSIAQAFAGPPGVGREKGQFSSDVSS